MTSEALIFFRRYIGVLLGTWFLGTAFVVWAGIVAPTSPVNLSAITPLQQHWSLYFTGYSFFFLADCSIALLGVPLVVWLKPDAFRAALIILLFGLSGALGQLADVEMLSGTQIFATALPQFSSASAMVFLQSLNARTNWLSVASFFPPALATWLAATAARNAGSRFGWVALTRFGAVYQLITGVLSAAAILSGQSFLVKLALVLAVFGFPIFVTIWLLWTMREMTRPSSLTSPNLKLDSSFP